MNYRVLILVIDCHCFRIHAVQNKAGYDPSKIFLLYHVHVRHRFKLLKMRPSIFIRYLKFVIATLRQKRTYCHMHKVLLLFFAEFAGNVAKFLYSNQEEYCLEIWLFAEAVNQFGFQFHQRV